MLSVKKKLRCPINILFSGKQTIMSAACECGSTDAVCKQCDAEVKKTYLISACRCQGPCNLESQEQHSIVGVQAWSKDEVRKIFYRVVLTILETNGKVHKNGTLIQAFSLWGGCQNNPGGVEFYMAWYMDYESDKICYLDVVHDFLASLFDPKEPSILSTRKTGQFSHQIEYGEYGHEYLWLNTDEVSTRVDKCLHFHNVDTNEYS